MSFIESKLVSVIMPAYNGERFIKQAIESMLAQTYTNWELIIVDDGSTDNTAQEVAKFNDPRIRYTFQENRGQAAALNCGLDIAHGEYITTLDVDDWYTPNSLSDRAGFLDSYQQYDVVYGDGVFCDKDGNKLKQFSELRTGDVTGDVYGVMLSNSFFGTGANVMIRKSVLKEYDIRYDESIVWCQDYDLYLRLAEKCQFGYVDSLMIWYRLHQDNMTITMPSGQRRESLVRAKLKTLATERFNNISNSQKNSFFYALMIHDLDDDIKRQMELMDRIQFQTLPRNDQARLIRVCAARYLSAGQNIKEVQAFLKKTWKLNPLDPKTISLIIFAYFNKGPIEWIFNAWREMKLRNRSTTSPFDRIT